MHGQEERAALRRKDGEGRAGGLGQQAAFTFILDSLHCCFCAFAHPSPAFPSSLVFLPVLIFCPRTQQAEALPG